MKEATGEASMTVVVVALIGLVAAAAAIIIPNLMRDVSNKASDVNKGLKISNSQMLGGEL